MHWIAIVFIGVAANLDNLGIGLAYGMRLTRIPLLSNVIIAVLAMMCSFSTMTIGTFLSHYVSSSAANLIGGCLLICIGLWTIIFFNKTLTQENKETDYVTNILRNPSAADIDRNNIISWKESILLGLALALNVMTIGIGAGLTGISPYGATLSIGILSMITIYGGVKIGHQIGGTWLGKYSTILSGLLLIAIGIYEIAV